MAEEVAIILLNDKLVHSGNVSELQFGMLGLHFQELILMSKKNAVCLENSIYFKDRMDSREKY